MAYVYVMEANGICKIGIAECVESRQKQIQTSCPYKIQRVWSCLAYNARECEKKMHDMYKAKRTSGEWFCINFETACKKVKEVCEKDLENAICDLEEANEKLERDLNYHKYILSRYDDIEKGKYIEKGQTLRNKIGLQFYKIKDAIKYMHMPLELLCFEIDRLKVPTVSINKNGLTETYVNVWAFRQLLLEDVGYLKN